MEYTRKDVVIVAYGRSACCRARKGGFANTNPIYYAAQTLKGVLNKIPQLKPEMIGDVITGCAFPINELSMNTSRLIASRAELPECVPAQTINRFCSSGLQAIATAANAIIAGEYDVAVAGGVECLTKCFEPYPEKYMNQWIQENYIGGYMSMGETAERVAEHYHITREDMEKMALESHQKAAKARFNGKLAQSIIPVINDQGEIITVDEGILAGADGILNTSLEKMASLKPCFRPEGRVTAATSSQTTDAAAYVVVMSADKAKELQIKPIAKYVGFSVVGCKSTEMGMGPLYAIPKVMSMTGLTTDDMDIIELNEAFASQALACIRELDLNMDKVNPYGGAMALGHPMGATGAFLTAKALDFLQDNNGKYALISMCIGGGMGAAGIFELC